MCKMLLLYWWWSLNLSNSCCSQGISCTCVGSRDCLIIFFFLSFLIEFPAQIAEETCSSSFFLREDLMKTPGMEDSLLDVDMNSSFFWMFGKWGGSNWMFLFILFSLLPSLIGLNKGPTSIFISLLWGNHDRILGEQSFGILGWSSCELSWW